MFGLIKGNLDSTKSRELQIWLAVVKKKSPEIRDSVVLFTMFAVIYTRFWQLINQLIYM